MRECRAGKGIREKGKEERLVLFTERLLHLRTFNNGGITQLALSPGIGTRFMYRRVDKNRILNMFIDA